MRSRIGKALIISAIVVALTSPLCRADAEDMVYETRAMTTVCRNAADVGKVVNSMIETSETPERSCFALRSGVRAVSKSEWRTRPQQFVIQSGTKAWINSNTQYYLNIPAGTIVYSEALGWGFVGYAALPSDNDSIFYTTNKYVAACREEGDLYIGYLPIYVRNYTASGGNIIDTREKTMIRSCFVIPPRSKVSTKRAWFNMRDNSNDRVFKFVTAAGVEAYGRLAEWTPASNTNQ